MKGRRRRFEGHNFDDPTQPGAFAIAGPGRGVDRRRRGESAACLSGADNSIPTEAGEAAVPLLCATLVDDAAEDREAHRRINDLEGQVRELESLVELVCPWAEEAYSTGSASSESNAAVWETDAPTTSPRRPSASHFGYQTNARSISDSTEAVASVPSMRNELQCPTASSRAGLGIANGFSGIAAAARANDDDASSDDEEKADDENKSEPDRTSSLIQFKRAAGRHGLFGVHFSKNLKPHRLDHFSVDGPELCNSRVGNSLKKLSLSQNELGCIPSMLAAGLPTLKHLDLSSCGLVKIPPEWNFPELTHLNLSNNGLSEFPAKVNWRCCRA